MLRAFLKLLFWETGVCARTIGTVPLHRHIRTILDPHLAKKSAVTHPNGIYCAVVTIYELTMPGFPQKSWEKKKKGIRGDTFIGAVSARGASIHKKYHIFQNKKNF